MRKTRETRKKTEEKKTVIWSKRNERKLGQKNENSNLAI